MSLPRLPHMTIPDDWEPIHVYNHTASKRVLEYENKIQFECIEDYDLDAGKFEKGQTYYGAEIHDYGRGWGIFIVNEENVYFFDVLEVEKYFKVIKPNKSL